MELEEVIEILLLILLEEFVLEEVGAVGRLRHLEQELLVHALELAPRLLPQVDAVPALDRCKAILIVLFNFKLFGFEEPLEEAAFA